MRAMLRAPSLSRALGRAARHSSSAANGSGSSVVRFVGAPWAEGQNLRGTEEAPGAFRQTGLPEAIRALGHDFEDMGDVDFGQVSAAAGTAADAGRAGIVNQSLMGAGLGAVFEHVKRAAHGATADGSEPFVLTVGGDHSIASGTIAALTTKHPDLGVIWVDAHADANTPRTSPSGHYHGMPMAHLLGWFDRPGECGAPGERAGDLAGFEWMPRGGCLAESKVAYIGLRDLDPLEIDALRASDVSVYCMRQVDRLGIARVIEMAIADVSGGESSPAAPLHLSLDIDGIDPRFAPGTGTTARGGLSAREIRYLCEELSLTRRLVSMDLVEVSPPLDTCHAATGRPDHGDDPHITASTPTVRLAAESVLAALGKTLY